MVIKTWITRQELALIVIAGVIGLHLMVITVLSHPLLPSNILQLLATLMAVLLCLVRARRSIGRYFRRLWYQLCIAFLISAAAQAEYVWHILVHKYQHNFPSLTDFLWLLSSFPILLVASRGQEQAEKDWTSYLDFAQACVGVCSLYAVMYVAPAGLSDSVIYDTQSLALLLACAIRYSTATTIAERIFFRDLTIYVLCYGVLSAAGLLAQDYGSPAGGLTDLAWSLPVLIFCTIAIRLPERLFRLTERSIPRTILPPHIHGISSLGLALTSITAGILLMLHRPHWGVPALAISCTLFALRTATRELQLKHAQLQLEYAALHDSLTGLANRSMLFREIEETDTQYSPVRALLFLDLDRFKVINDSLGHTFGDRLLIQVAKILRSAVRPGDTVARLGGDEFVILLNGVPEGVTAEAIAERILNTLRPPIWLDDRPIHITGSVGIVAVNECTPTADLLRNADAAMYKAKSMGKNRAHTFDQSILQETTRELEVEAALRASLEGGSIDISYQPIYSLHGDSLEGFEALARWTYPRRGTVPPDEFIPLAEDTGLIIELGKQVLRKACCQLTIWNRRFGSRLFVSVNVSGRQLADKNFLASVSEILKEAQLDTALLKFEITESVLLSDRRSAEKILGAARATGIEIWLDDFGTGYSSLSYLLDFPFDAIKIDKSFVRDVEHDDRRAEMVRTIIQLGVNLKKKVIAEGIETLAQLQFVARLKCNSAQGFLYSRPLTSEAMTVILESEMRACFTPKVNEERQSL